MRRTWLASAVAALCAAAACSGGGDPGRLTTRQTTSTPPTAASLAPTAPAPPSQAVVSGTVKAVDQVGDGTTIVVAEVTIHGAGGWIIVHADAGGPGDVVGHAAVPEGTTKNVVVRLDTKVATGAYWPMLHRDGGEVGTYQWPAGPDGPVRPPGGGTTYAARRITLTVG